MDVVVFTHRKQAFDAEDHVDDVDEHVAAIAHVGVLVGVVALPIAVDDVQHRPDLPFLVPLELHRRSYAGRAETVFLVDVGDLTTAV